MAIAVTTSDSPNPTILTLIVHIPDLVHFYPAFVSWGHGEKNTPKQISVNPPRRSG